MSDNFLKEIYSTIDPIDDKLSEYGILIAKKIRELMEKNNNMTQKELAAKLGKKESYISRILSGDVNITLRTIAAFESIFDEKLIRIDLHSASAQKEIYCILIESNQYEKLLFRNNNLRNVNVGQIEYSIPN